MPYKDKEKRKEYNETYYQSKKEEIAIQKRDYYKKNREKILLARQETHALIGKEKNERLRKQRLENLDLFRAKDREYYHKNKEHKSKTRREWYMKNSAAARRWWLKNKYALTEEQYNTLLIRQDGKCAICRRSPNGRARWGRLHIDHCHKTEKVRGLLCGNCNLALGYMNDNPETLLSAIKYLIDYDEEVKLKIEAEVEENGIYAQ